MMNIAIDMQGVQSNSRYRGIGRYVYAVVREMLRNNPGHRLDLVFNGHLTESLQAAKQALPSDERLAIHAFYPPLPIYEGDDANQSRRACALILRCELIKSLKPDLCFVPSLFEGFQCDVAVSVSDLEQAGIPCVVFAHDLIPLINSEYYLDAVPGFRAFYEQKVEELRLASAWLANSHSTATELTEYLAIPENRIGTTHLGVDAQFAASQVDELDPDIAKQYGITQPYFIYSGGNDPRKNLPKLIEAFALLKGEAANTQLVLVGKSQPDADEQIVRKAKQLGVAPQRIVFTGFVSDETLIALYQGSLCFVFPSWHEGFGLPAVEAMACHTAVLVADRTSLPEVMDEPQAQFNPHDADDIAARMQQVYDQPNFRAHLQAYGHARAAQFSWARTAQKTWSYLETFAQSSSSRHTGEQQTKQQNALPELAFVSPLPPEQTGIATYSAELLPALCDYFQITLITDLTKPDLPELGSKITVRDTTWFDAHGLDFEHIIYQIGNAPYHMRMPQWLSQYPGTVVLHDFFLGGLYASAESQRSQGLSDWEQALHHAHGYPALAAKISADRQGNPAESYPRIMGRWPANLSVLEDAPKVIVHADFSRSLLAQYYPSATDKHWATIPLVRDTQRRFTQTQARKALGINADTLLVCSFGILAESKQNRRLARIWAENSFGEQGKLVFVGKHIDASYQKALDAIVEADSSIEVTGWVDDAQYHQYLAAANIAVQLRQETRGETSAAVLDAMNYANAVIVNQNGSMAELPVDATLALADDFTDTQLAEALRSLLESATRREQLGQKAREKITTDHTPQACARAYRKVILAPAGHPTGYVRESIQALSELATHLNDQNREQLALGIHQTFPRKRYRPTLYLDLTATFADNHKTGIERYALRLFEALIARQQQDYNLVAVKLVAHDDYYVYQTAHADLIAAIYDEQIRPRNEEVADPAPGDVLLTLDLPMQQHIQAQQQGLFSQWQASGTRCYATVFDLLPVHLPEYFPPGVEPVFTQWLNAITQFDGLLTISQTVADECREWLDANQPQRAGQIDIQPLPLGRDIATSGQTQVNIKAQYALTGPVFILVGTIEPRKGHTAVLAAFEQLWAQGVQAQLVVIGRPGWQGLPASDQRDLPQILSHLTELNRNQPYCHWISNADDETLKAFYQQADALIAPSFGEGLGLPLLEAMQENCRILARDLPVFREIAEGYATFFNEDQPDNTLEACVQAWLENPPPKPHNGPQRSAQYQWSNTAEQCIAYLKNKTSISTRNG